VHSSHVFLFAKVTITQAFSQINAPGIEQTAKDLLTEGHTTRFQDQYGDMFVRGLLRGGLFFATIQIFCKDAAEKESIKAKVSASYASISGSVQFDANFQQTITEHSTKVLCHIEGGDRSKPLPVSVDTMTERAIHFPSELEHRGVPYVALLDSYSILPLPDPPNYIDLQLQKDVLTECAHLRDQDLMELNDIDYITRHPDEFVDVNMYPINQLRNDLNDDLRAIATAASKALNYPKQAEVPHLKQAGPIDLPKRKAGLPPLVKVPDLRGMKDYDPVPILKSIGLQVWYEDMDGRHVEGIISGAGLAFVIHEQDPQPGAEVHKGAIVHVRGSEDFV
jgi:hypothetical protein